MIARLTRELWSTYSELSCDFVDITPFILKIPCKKRIQFQKKILKACFVPLESSIKHSERHSREQDKDYSQFSYELLNFVHSNYEPAAHNFQSQRFLLKVTSLEQQRVVPVASFALGIYFISAVRFQLVYFKFQVDLIETVTLKNAWPAPLFLDLHF